MTWHGIKILWWFGLGWVPVIVGRLTKKILVELRCPPGECYLPGAWTTSDLHALSFIFALFIWPVCVWHVAGLTYQIIHNMQDRKHDASE